MKRLLIIRSSRQSFWGSCRVISPNLQNSYQLLASPECEIKFFDISDLFLKDDALKDGNYITDLAQTLRDYNPTEIIFTDHRPHPYEILIFLSMHYPLKDLPPLVFHLYGDFTFFAQSWALIGEKLKGHKIKLIVASESQYKLVKNFSNSEVNIETFIFPVDEKDYYYDHDERLETRRQFQIRDYEQVILYSGRISLQKNVDILISEYAEIFKNSVFPTKLWIVGAFDDHGANFQGVVNYEGFMYAKIHQLLESLPKEIASSIRLWGLQPKETLRKLKNAADMFMSLSLYHDEDFGMSPAEALSCGLPTLLTDWGGYSSFTSKRWFCNLIPVELTKYGHQLKVSKMQEFFEMFNLAFINQHDRTKWSQEFLKEFSIRSSSQKLKAILDKDYLEFQGFNWNLAYYSNVYWTLLHGRQLSIHLNPSSDNFYAQIYQHYISGKNI